MKVSDLIAMLEDCEPNADVFIMSQSNYPFEQMISGVAVRREWLDEEDDDEQEDQPETPPRVPSHGNRWNVSEAKLPRSDVFILEGEQTRYGTKKAWDNAR